MEQDIHRLSSPSHNCLTTLHLTLSTIFAFTTCLLDLLCLSTILFLNQFLLISFLNLHVLMRVLTTVFITCSLYKLILILPLIHKALTRILRFSYFFFCTLSFGHWVILVITLGTDSKNTIIIYIICNKGHRSEQHHQSAE